MCCTFDYRHPIDTPCRLHVDAAWAGAFAILPAQREAHFRGLEGADSYDVNPHKALLCGWEW